MSLCWPDGAWLLLLFQLLQGFALCGIQLTIPFYFAAVHGLALSSTLRLRSLFLIATSVSSLVGWLLADCLGTFQLIFYGLIGSVVGQFLTIFSSLLPRIPRSTNLTANQTDAVRYAEFHLYFDFISFGLVAVAVGSAIPSLLAFAGGQFRQKKKRAQFFAYFYLSTIFGCVFSHTANISLDQFACLWEGKCFPLLLTLHFLATLASALLLVGTRKCLAETRQSTTLGELISCAMYAIRNRRKYRLAHPNFCYWMDAAADRYPISIIDSVKRLIRLVKVLSPLVAFWALLDRSGVSFALQSQQMDGRISIDFVVLPQQFGLVHFLLVAVTVLVVYNGLIWTCKYAKRPLAKMNVGVLLAVFAFVATGFVQISIDHTSPLIAPKPNRTRYTFVNFAGQNLLIADRQRRSFLGLHGANTSSADFWAGFSPRIEEGASNVSILYRSFESNVAVVEFRKNKKLSIFLDPSIMEKEEKGSEGDFSCPERACLVMLFHRKNHMTLPWKESLDEDYYDDYYLEDDDEDVGPIAKGSSTVELNSDISASVRPYVLRKGADGASTLYFTRHFSFNVHYRGALHLRNQVLEKNGLLNLWITVTSTERPEESLFETALFPNTTIHSPFDRFDLVPHYRSTGSYAVLLVRKNENTTDVLRQLAIIQPRMGGVYALVVQPESFSMRSVAGFVKALNLTVIELVAPNEVPIIWQLLAFSFLAVAEVLVVPASFEFAYAEAPRMLKTSGEAILMGTVALGLGASWLIRDYNIADNQTTEFFFEAAFLLVGSVALMLLSYRYARDAGKDRIAVESVNECSFEERGIDGCFSRRPTRGRRRASDDTLLLRRARQHNPDETTAV